MEFGHAPDCRITIDREEDIGPTDFSYGSLEGYLNTKVLVDDQKARQLLAAARY